MVFDRVLECCALRLRRRLNNPLCGVLDLCVEGQPLFGDELDSVGEVVRGENALAEGCDFCVFLVGDCVGCGVGGLVVLFALRQPLSQLLNGAVR